MNIFVKISEYPKTVVLIVLCLTFFLSWQAFIGLFDDNGKLKLDNSIEPFFSRQSEAYPFYKATNREFGSDKLAIIAVQPLSATGFDLKLMLLLNQLHQRISIELPGVEEVVSIINTPQLSGTCIGKSFFHHEQLASVCQNILQKFEQELACVRSPKYEQEPSDTEEESDLLSVLEENPDELPDSDVSAMEQSETVSVSQFHCTPQLREMTEGQLIAKYEAKVSQVFDRLKKHQLISGDLLSKDFTTTAIIVRFLSDAIPESEETQKALTRLLDDIRTDKIKIAHAGQPREEFESARMLRNDIFNILPISAFLILIVLLFLFQSIRGVVIPLLVVAIGLCWTAGLLVIFNVTLNLVTLMLPPLLIAVGSAYLIHFMAHYYQVSKYCNHSRKEITRRTLDGITLPLLVTAFTTLVGFLALTSSPIPAVREMGLLAGVGIMIITLLALTFAPTCLSFLPISNPESRALRLGLTDHLLTLIGRLISRHSFKIISLWIFVGIIATVGLFQITIDSSTRNMSEKTAVMMDKKFIESKLAGTTFLRLVFSSQHSPESLQTASTMYGILELKNWLLENENNIDVVDKIRFDKIYTPLEYIDLERQGLDNLKDSEVVNFFLRPRNKNLHFLNNSQTLLNITIRLSFESTYSFLKFKKRLDDKINALLPNLKVQYTGSAMLASESADNIVKSQLLSLALALILIFIILSLLFLSWKMGVMALYSNIISILIFFGVLGWFSISIGVTISVIAAIALGIGVDDTIHFIINYNRNLHDLADNKAASNKTLVHIGRPMIYTTVALTLGFSVFLISNMDSQVLFGILTAFTLCVCLAADINLLPSILIRSRLITAWDYLQINYTEDFLKSILLFQDMSIRESKLATLMTDTREYGHGDIIYEENDPVRDFFVILEGSVDIYLEGKYHGRRKTLTRLHQGRSFGALALFPHTMRMASARSADHTQLLVLTPLNLHNLQKRYPGIAAKLFFNLAKSLAKEIKEDFYRKMATPSPLGFEKSQSEKIELIRILNQIMTGVIRSSRVRKIASIFRWFGRSQSMTDQLYYTVMKDTSDENSTLSKLIDSIISTGKLTYQQKMHLKKIIYSDNTPSPMEQDRLKKLKWLIREGKVVELKPEFASIFHRMTDKDLQWLQKNFEIQQVPAGAKVFSEGDYGDHMMIVFSGRFNTFITVNQKTIPISTIIPGDSIGEMSLLIDDHTRSVTAKALEDSEVFYISRPGFEKLMKTNKKLAALFSYNLVGLLSHRLRRSTSLLYG